MSAEMFLAAWDGAAVAGDADVIAMLVGGFPIIGMMIFMLRRQRLAVLADERGLRVGGRVIGWNDVRGMQSGREESRSWYRVLTQQGVVEFESDDLAQDPLLLQREIVERAHLMPVANAQPSRELKARHVTRYEEWAPPPPAVELTAPTPLASFAAPPAPITANDRGLLGKAGAGIAAAFVLMLKFAKVGLLGGLKVLKFGKLLPTALSMLVTVWVYAQIWTWWFALGFVVLIFVHEMGHAVVIRAKGLRTSPIVFVPFLGAFISIKDQFRDARTEAETAYGGPAAGAFAATVCFGLYLVTHSGFWLGLAYAGFFLNLFNLMPVSPLDGGRIVTAISTWLWLVGLLVAGTLGIMRGSPLLLMIVVFGAFRAWGEWKRRRSGSSSEYYQLTPRYRALIACAYFGLCGYLGWMTHRALELSQPN